jgi:hypothetical protein
MDWQQITLPPSASEFPEPTGITRQFQNIYEKESLPKGFSVYLSASQQGRTLYFSPAVLEIESCRELLGSLERQYQNRLSPCDPPPRFSVSLEAGEDLLK